MSDTVRFDDGGLVPVVVQDERTGRVLMVAFANEEALEATRTTGEAHFWSRSRQELWRKGATSGNTMAVRQMRVDCDRDTVLYLVDPAGPACHTGTETCFSPEGERPAAGFAWLEILDSVIASRLAERPEGSYTTALVDAGVDGPARKVVEEAAEVAFAAKDHAAGDADDRRVAEEAADLLYHVLVLLAERRIPAADLIDVLEERFG
ncbi:MAG TPA: bifunctional phosphoribosyl-AMP cyclohydrolase/phosphoribosyl-ATP diphosphatase HisIE [Acidimicrobiia bacterium]|nr:bifunctional phosphoribosyl-AMP cyclohydrolase/phosphoribosyl-ATP diphosphatase HisIE [Acidimicrobiia bacterium]